MVTPPKEVVMLNRWPLALAALLALAAPPLAGQAAPLRVPTLVDKLANGLTLLVHEDHSAPVVSVTLTL